jgi:hypothetical protein
MPGLPEAYRHEPTFLEDRKLTRLLGRHLRIADAQFERHPALPVQGSRYRRTSTCAGPVSSLRFPFKRRARASALHPALLTPALAMMLETSKRGWLGRRSENPLHKPPARNQGLPFDEQTTSPATKLRRGVQDPPLDQRKRHVDLEGYGPQGTCARCRGRHAGTRRSAGGEASVDRTRRHETDIRRNDRAEARGTCRLR